MAQLVIYGKSYGPHPFVVQIRDLKTHEPLENIHVGDSKFFTYILCNTGDYIDLFTNFIFKLVPSSGIIQWT